MAAERKLFFPLRVLAVLLAFLLAGPAFSVGARADTVDVPDKVVLTNFKLYSPASGQAELPVTVSADGTVFTVDDTKGYDFEGLRAFDNYPKISFNTNFQRIGVIGIYGSYFQPSMSFHYCNTYFGYLHNSPDATILPYNTDPHYIITKFTLYGEDMTGLVTGRQYGPIPSSKTEFTLRLRKWEDQYQKSYTSPVWNNSIFFCSEYDYGTSKAPWRKVADKPHHYEYVAAQNVTFPYTLTIRCAIHYQTKAYLDGAQIFMPGANTLCTKTLTFTSKKTSYEFVIDPGNSMDDKHTIGTKSYWKISVTGKDASGAGGLRQSDGYSAAISVGSIAAKTWAGKQIKPAVSVTANGQKLVKGTDYTVKYGANKAIGKGTVTITGKGKYAGSKTVSFSIVPKKNSISKITPAKKQMTVKWKPVSAAQGVTKYELRWREKGTVTWKTKAYAVSASSATIKSLKKGKRYEVQVRSYKKVSGKKYYSTWSAAKTSGTIR